MTVKLRWSFILLLIIWTKNGSTTLHLKPIGTNACISKQTCHDCIQTPSCAWCFVPDFDNKRCFLPNVNVRIFEECPENYTFNPDNEYIKIRHKELWKGSYTIDGGSQEGIYIESGEYQSIKGSFHTASASASRTAFNSKQEAVQLYPQEINLRLRINEVQKIKIEYAQAEDYPVDLYYLMDLSNSMKDDKQKLSDLGQLLVESMSNITSNFRLGFGSFVDKVAIPYVSVVPKALKEPCDGCAAPYGYLNHMPLSQNTERFAKEVRDAPVSGNLDAPEGGFDAIMQAIVCRDEIKWREKARKLLLFSTDAGFHFAGDGKLAGIVKPNDGCCHLDKKGLYTHSTLQDYPSISQINLKVKENSVNIIWAVTEEQIKIYQALTKHIEGSYAAKLSEDSSNIVDLVREQYNAISSSVEMKDTASNYVNIKYYSSCLGGGQMVETNKCDGLKVGNKIEFTAEIVISACPKDRSEWNQKFFIYPVGINESLAVNLEMICDCQCENRDENGFEFQSLICNGHGDLSCGICMCYDGYFGKNCECGTDDTGQMLINEFACRRDNTSNVDCGGRGSCECNVCNCNSREDSTEMIWGPFCECDNFSCDRRNNTICSGHGTCNCGNCECAPGWKGDACECSTDTNSCVKYGLECSGHGVCECGKCKCNIEGETRYSGQFCQICRTCPSRCEELKPCILCQAFKAGNLTESECNSTCTEFQPEIVETLEVDVDQEETGCWGYDEKDCKYYFAYYYNMTLNKLQVKVQRARECPPQVFVLGIVLGVIAAVVLIGLALLLVWKLLTTIHDRREFARFEKERMMAKWDASENPIYKQATSTFKNPTYTAGGVLAPLNKRLRDEGGAPAAPIPVKKVPLIETETDAGGDAYTLIYKKKHTSYTRTVSPSERQGSFERTASYINDNANETTLTNRRAGQSMRGYRQATLDSTTGYDARGYKSEIVALATHRPAIQAQSKQGYSQSSFERMIGYDATDDSNETIAINRRPPSPGQSMQGFRQAAYERTTGYDVNSGMNDFTAQEQSTQGYRQASFGSMTGYGINNAVNEAAAHRTAALGQSSQSYRQDTFDNTTGYEANTCRSEIVALGKHRPAIEGQSAQGYSQSSFERTIGYDVTDNANETTSFVNHRSPTPGQSARGYRQANYERMVGYDANYDANETDTLTTRRNDAQGLSLSLTSEAPPSARLVYHHTTYN